MYMDNTIRETPLGKIYQWITRPMDGRFLVNRILTQFQSIIPQITYKLGNKFQKTHNFQKWKNLQNTITLIKSSNSINNNGTKYTSDMMQCEVYNKYHVGSISTKSVQTESDHEETSGQIYIAWHFSRCWLGVPKNINSWKTNKRQGLL